MEVRAVGINIRRGNLVDLITYGDDYGFVIKVTSWIEIL